ncbi:hypothetical protein GCM10020360_28020 [Nonlabens tegetincola]
MTFPEELAVALIAAGVAFAVSVLFRFLDRQRPKWRVEVSKEATPLHDKSGFYVEVTLRNAGNGAAYDARIFTSLQTTLSRPASSVVMPGEELHALVPVRLAQEPERGGMGGPIRVPLEAEHLAGARVKIRWTLPPLFWVVHQRKLSLRRALLRQTRFETDV